MEEREGLKGSRLPPLDDSIIKAGGLLKRTTPEDSVQK